MKAIAAPVVTVLRVASNRAARRSAATKSRTTVDHRRVSGPRGRTPTRSGCPGGEVDINRGRALTAASLEREERASDDRMLLAGGFASLTLATGARAGRGHWRAGATGVGTGTSRRGRRGHPGVGAESGTNDGGAVSVTMRSHGVGSGAWWSAGGFEVSLPGGLKPGVMRLASERARWPPWPIVTVLLVDVERVADAA